MFIKTSMNTVKHSVPSWTCSQDPSLASTALFLSRLCTKSLSHRSQASCMHATAHPVAISHCTVPLQPDLLSLLPLAPPSHDIAPVAARRSVTAVLFHLLLHRVLGMLLGPFFQPILPDWTIPLPMTLLATVMTVRLVSFVNFPILCQQRCRSTLCFWIHLLFLFQQSCR